MTILICNFLKLFIALSKVIFVKKILNWKTILFILVLKNKQIKVQI